MSIAKFICPKSRSGSTGQQTDPKATPSANQPTNEGSGAGTHCNVEFIAVLLIKTSVPINANYASVTRV